MITLREVDILGIFVSPALVCLLAAMILSAVLRRLFDRIQLDRYIWNRTLFDLALLVCSTDLLVLSLRSAAR
jgi:protein AaeX